MNTWENTILTDKGRALMAKMTEGTGLVITRAASGAGYVTPGLLAKQTEVTEPMQSLVFRPVSYPEAGKCAITVDLRNDDLDEGYNATQVGIYAEDPDDGEILLFITQAHDAQSGTIIPSKTEMAGYSAEWSFYFQYGQADEVTIAVDPSNSVTRLEMKEYVESQAGAGRTMYGDINMGGNKITNVAEPTQGSDVATRHFVEQHTIEGNTYVAVDYNNDGNIVLKPYVPGVDDFGVEDNNHPGCFYRTVDGTVEWINPPMVYSEEYRTAERHNGKIVYTKLVNFGNLPNATIKKVAIGTNIELVSIDGHLSSRTHHSPFAPNEAVKGIYYEVSEGNLCIETTIDYSKWYATFTLKYTK